RYRGIKKLRAWPYYERSASKSHKRCYLIYCCRASSPQSLSSTEHFKQKIRNLVAAIVTNTVQDYFSVRQLSAIVFPTTAGDKRVAQMRKWTLEVLTEVKAPAELMTLFLFTAPAPSLTPSALFLTPLWLTPIPSYPPVSLFGV